MNEKENEMKKLILLFVSCLVLACAFEIEAQAPSPYPVVDKVAAKVIQKYQTSSCAQLLAQKQQPPQPMEQRAVAMLHSDANMRRYFLNKVAAPVANKLFECGMIP
jgi:ABC-type transporter MlaC component